LKGDFDMGLSQQDIIAEAIISGRHTYQIETDKGIFTCHTRTFKDDRMIAMKRDELIAQDGGDPRLASSDTLNTYYIQAFLEVVIDKYPEGFVLEAADTNTVLELYTKIQQYEDNFRKNGNTINAANSKKG
jgi:hypothetical protein